MNIDGKLYGLPQDSGPMALFYNTTVFDQFGIAVPTTWDEYIAAGEQLHAADPTKYITTDTGDAGFATSMIWQAGGHPFAVDGADITVDLADEGTRSGPTSGTSCSRRTCSPTSRAGATSGSRASATARSRASWSGAWMPGVLESSVPDAAGDWRVAPMPTYDGEPVTAENGGGGQAVLKQSKNPALAAAFLEWLNSDPESIKIFLESGGFPSTVAELESEEFVDQESEYFGGQKINEVLTQAAKDVGPAGRTCPTRCTPTASSATPSARPTRTRPTSTRASRPGRSQLVDYGNEQGFAVRLNRSRSEP